MTDTINSTDIDLETARRLLRHHVAKDIPTMLWGSPGVGKSDIVRQVAIELGMGMVDFRAILRDPVDLRGMPFVDSVNKTTIWLPPADLPQVDRDGATGILFLDEINAAPPSMQAACFGLILDRQVGEYKLPKGWIPIAAGNHQKDRAAAQRMPTALDNRLAHLFVKADSETFVSWLNVNNKSPMLAAFMRLRPDLVHKMNPDSHAFPSPRSWTQAEKSMDGVEADIRVQSIGSIVGFEAASEFEGFLRTYMALPTIQEVVSNPMGAKCPGDSEIAARWAIVSAMAYHAKPENFGAIMTYAKRLPREFSVLLIKDAVKRTPALKKARAFLDWAIENQDVTFG